VPSAAATPASAPTPVVAAENGRQARRRAESRRRLLEAARRLFVERGYHATRPADIAREADVANGTFYLHFADKSDAFRAFVDEAASEVQTALGARLEGVRGFEARLRASLDGILDWVGRHPGALRTAFTDPAVIAPDAPRTPTLRDRLAEQMARGLRQGMERGELRDDFDPELIAYGIVGFAEQAISQGSRGGVDREALLANVTTFCARALLAPGSQEESQP
jgi:AcrR family transcriptional regulator